MSADPVASDYWRRGGLSRRSEPQVLPAVGAQFRASFVGPAAVKAGGGGESPAGKRGRGTFGVFSCGPRDKGEGRRSSRKIPRSPRADLSRSSSRVSGNRRKPRGPQPSARKREGASKGLLEEGEQGSRVHGSEGNLPRPGDRSVGREDLFALTLGPLALGPYAFRLS